VPARARPVTSTWIRRGSIGLASETQQKKRCLRKSLMGNRTAGFLVRSKSRRTSTALSSACRQSRFRFFCCSIQVGLSSLSTGLTEPYKAIGSRRYRRRGQAVLQLANRRNAYHPSRQIRTFSPSLRGREERPCGKRMLSTSVAPTLLVLDDGHARIAMNLVLPPAHRRSHPSRTSIVRISVGGTTPQS
jgi:hypothetical protein